eukprot:GFUD01017381.1.p1 GENE.GFUD01017381.1~~GFUD01017381.1.p1  ORF type:complete len:549 (+),score=125.45 GFUD01017381.1:12-1658(+)
MLNSHKQQAVGYNTQANREEASATNQIERNDTGPGGADKTDTDTEGEDSLSNSGDAKRLPSTDEGPCHSNNQAPSSPDYGVLVCRLCSSPHPACTSLLTPSLHPLIACLPVRIHHSDPPSLPPLVCPDCLAKLDLCHKFFCQIYSAHTRLLGGQEVDIFFKQDMTTIIGQKVIKEEPEEICEQKLDEEGYRKDPDQEQNDQQLNNNDIKKLRNMKMVIKSQTAPEKRSRKKAGHSKLRLFSLPSLTTCTLCGVESSSHPANMEHWRDTHPGEEVLYLCKEGQANSCNHSTKDLADMRDHLKEHLFKEGKIGQCEICAKYFPKGHLKTHIKVVHEGVKSHQCQTCMKGFKTSKMLQAHELIHAPDDVKYQFSCHECGKRFTQRGNLDTHIKSHRGVKPFKCDSCEKAFLTSSALKSHTLTHTGEKPFKCEDCDAKYSSSSQLKNHVMVKHLNVHRYQCTYCPVKYNRLELLRNHEMSHTGETPFKCQVCGKGFRRKDKLRIHEVLHGPDEDKYRYPCHVCGKRFTQSNNLKTHIMSLQKHQKLALQTTP